MPLVSQFGVFPSWHVLLASGISNIDPRRKGAWILPELIVSYASDDMNVLVFLMLIILVSTRYVHQFKKLNQMNLKGLMQSHFDCIWSLSFFFMKNKFYVVNELLAVDCFQDYSVKCIWFYVLHHDTLSHNTIRHIDGLVQERRNSSALAMELRLYCINPLIYIVAFVKVWPRSWFELQKFNACPFRQAMECLLWVVYIKNFPSGNSTALSLPANASCSGSCQNDNEMLLYWWNFCHWLHRKLSKWQLPMQPVRKIL